MRYQSKQWLGLLGVLGMLGGTLAACGGSTNGTSTGATTPAGSGSTGSGATTAAGSASNCTNVQLSYWNPFTGPDGAFMKKMVDQYNTENSGKVTIKVQTQPQPYYDKLSAALTSDSLPDVMIVHLDQVATWAARGALQPLDEVVKNIGLTDADFPAAVWQNRAYKGKRYSIPLDIHPLVFYWNKKLLQEAGINDVPKDAASFEAAATKLTQGNVKGFVEPIAWPSGQIGTVLLNQFGGKLTDDAGEKAMFNSDAGKKALEYMVKLNKAAFSQPQVAPDAQANAFKQGTNGMTMDGIWMIAGFKDAGVDLGAGPVPQFGTEMHTWAGSHNLTLPVHKKGEDPCKVQEGGKFIAWLTEHAATWAEGGQIPARLSARNSEEFKKLPLQAAIAPSVDTVIFPPPVPGITDAQDQYWDAINNVLNGKKDIPTALSDAEKKANELLAQNKQKYQ